MIITKGVVNYGLTRHELDEFINSAEYNPSEWIIDWDQATPETLGDSRWNLLPMTSDANYVKLEMIPQSQH